MSVMWADGGLALLTSPLAPHPPLANGPELSLATTHTLLLTLFLQPSHKLIATMPEPISVLFVCLGNICRSTMAEGIFRSIAKDPKYSSKIGTIDSCGTAAYHQGDPPDSRTMATLEQNGITDYDHEARRVSSPSSPLAAPALRQTSCCGRKQLRIPSRAVG